MLAVATLLAPTAPAQDIPVRQEEPECRPDAVARPDTAAFTLYLSPPESASGAPEAPAYAPFVQAVGSVFEPPAGVTLETWPGTFYEAPENLPREELTSAVGPLTGRVRFKLRRGRARDVAWELLPDSREVTRAVQDAVRRADSLGFFAGLDAPPGQRGMVRIGVSMTADTPPAGAMPVMRVRMPYRRVDSPVEILEIPRPSYPPAGQRRGIEGDVTLQYVVGEDGGVQRSSIRVIEANYFDFVEAAADAIAASRFRPARAGGCPVRLQVQQRIRFKTR